ncbi:hypothetical protein GCM10007315_35100 [Gemmobacter tilapiae]|uniref:Uncharacterized protein n=2 Tax=Neogemmobacter tilapiae TaxID=875041 RepID=A0A918TX80_9RHOB|nr:hypothetical protein GCM10007315_35100 [Gemmobacter tilapiae]
MDEGLSWRRHCWSKARADLLPVLPIEVVRLRVKRAAELGLDYRTYAGVRAQTGHDLVGFLFSSNALGLLRAGDTVPVARMEKLAGLVAERVGLSRPGLSPGAMLQACPPLTGAAPGPAPLAAWAQARDALRSALRGVPGDRMLLVGDAPWEADWAAIGRLAGHLPAARFFAA